MIVCRIDGKAKSKARGLDDLALPPATFCNADWQTQCTQRSRVARAVVVRRTQDCDVPRLQIAQGLGMPVDDGDLIIRQQRQEPISDEMLGFSARACAAFVGQLDDFQGGVVPAAFCAASAV